MLNEVGLDTMVLSESQQDYLKIVLDLINEKKVARVKEIALRKEVSMPSVTEAMRKLAKDDYVQYSAREFVELTSKGFRAAHRLSSKNIFLKNFLVDVLNIDVTVAEKEACELEHHLSIATLDRLILLYQFLCECKKNDKQTLELFKKCIDSAEGTIESDPECQSCFIISNFPHQPEKNTVHILLSQLERGQKARIIMLGPDPDIRRNIIEKGLMPGTMITVQEVGNEDQSYVLKTDGCLVEISQDAADMIETAIEQKDYQKRLSDIPAGNSFKVVKIFAQGEIRRRLLDIGFIKNEKGGVIREALMKDPIEIEIKGAKVSLRRSEAALICVEEIA
ncbi:MAG: FeoA domain-containing protein [Candidatus Marinimicrobia bacterium]|nr:FeoA domain-containing protein [Candidatus Neomarinimicrobiota bacterium]